MNLAQLMDADNIAEALTPEQLSEISEKVYEHYLTDVESRAAWLEAYQKWLAMTNQEIEDKTTPWPGAANVKYPLMTQAAMNFNARVVPAIMSNNEPVGISIEGDDQEGEKTEIARMVSKHMNYQLVTEMVEWEDELDTLLMALPVSGLEFKKTYFDGQKGRNVSRHVTPLNLVINYYADKIENSRKTEVHKWNKNYIVERIAAGKFRQIDWKTHPDPVPGRHTNSDEGPGERNGRDEPAKVDSATPYTVLEYHGWWDLDDDGYEEPYIITYVEESKEILEIVPRFDEKSIKVNAAGELVAIVPYESYTKYGFIPNPDGSFYDIGFGNILYPINATVNTAINMMLDAGASSIMNSGFVGRGLKIRGGMFTMKPNTWMTVNGTGDDIRKSFVPMPTKEPSNVLMSLMMYMVEAGQKLSSTTDIFSGEHPGQNTKAGVTQAVRDEGQKVFNAIYKRIRNAFRRELDKLYELNGIVLNAEEGQETELARGASKFSIMPEFYDSTMVNIQPSADPNTAIKEQKIQAALAALELILATKVGNPEAAQRRVLIAMEVENVDELQPVDAQQNDPQLQMAQQQAQIEASQRDFDAQMQLREQGLKEWEAQAKIEIRKAELMLEAGEKDARIDIDIQKLNTETIQQELDREERIDDRQRAAAAQAEQGPMAGVESATNNGMV